jgi:TPR repeat protein
MNFELSGQEPADAMDCFELGIICASGQGEHAVDMIEAHKWFNIAAARGCSGAVQMRREVAEQMSDSEIGLAQRAARDWLRSHPVCQPAPAIAIAA